MTNARSRLAALAAAAGYGPDALQLIAEAALPAHGPGDRMDEAGLTHVGSALAVLAQCGFSEAELTDVVADYRGRYDERHWRTEFWRRQLRNAALRFTHPRFYGLSPCEADPARLVEFGHPADDDELPSAPLARAA